MLSLWMKDSTELDAEPNMDISNTGPELCRVCLRLVAAEREARACLRGRPA